MGWWFACLLTVLAMSGCASAPVVESRFDEQTGLTLVWLDEPVVLAYTVPRVATTARDYAYLGPLQLNRLGEIESYVWVGVASTLDRAAIDEQPPALTHLVLLLDGVPMQLQLEPWTEGVEPPYVIPAPLLFSQQARVAGDQLQRIASARRVEARFTTADGVDRRYTLWRGDYSAWNQFALGEDARAARAALTR